jgi:hypothetical protein
VAIAELYHAWYKWLRMSDDSTFDLNLYGALVGSPPQLAPALSNQEKARAIAYWFVENFEPTIFSNFENDGGTYDPEWVVKHHYMASEPDEVCRQAITEIISRFPGAQEFKIRTRVVNYVDDGADLPDVQDFYDEMQQRVRELEGTLQQAPKPPAGIGHNQPPEAIEEAPLSQKDREEIAVAITVLKEQTVTPWDAGRAAEAARNTIKSKGEKLREWLAKHGESFASEAVKSAGKEFGKWAPRVFLGLLVDQMLGVSEAVLTWLKHLPLG